jgi:hypothetical protein
MGTAPDAVKRLVDRFDQDRKVFQSGDYKEQQLRLLTELVGSQSTELDCVNL